MKYLQANYHKKSKDAAFRYYVTDVLKNINESVANTMSGKYMQARFYDILNPPKEETRTAEEIIQHIKDGLDKIGA